MNREDPAEEQVPFLSGIHKFVPFQAQELFSIYGTGYSQALEVSIPPSYVLSTQPGMMLHASPQLKLEIDTGGFGQAISRAVAGGSIFRLNVYNRTDTNQTFAMASKTPGSILPIDLRTIPNTAFIFKKSAFVAAMGMEWSINMRIAPSLGTACFGGQGVILNEIRGNTIVWLSGCGSLLEKMLQPNETMAVDTRCLLGFDSSVRFEVGLMGEDCPTWCFGGAGLFNTIVTGPGRIIIQSYPIEKFAALLPSKNNDNGGGGGGGGGG